MVSLFLDTEFNGLDGELISLALYDPGIPERYFYEIKTIPINPDPFVAAHVIPALGPFRQTISEAVFRARLRSFMASFAEPIEVIADWPADFEHLFRELNPRGAPWDVEVEFTARLVRSGEVKSELPHNALHDARALARWYKSVAEA